MEKLNSIVSSTVLKLALAMITAFLAFSETTIKSITNNWLNECKIILEIQDPSIFIPFDTKNVSRRGRNKSRVINNNDAINSKIETVSIKIITLGVISIPISLTIGSEPHKIESITLKEKTIDESLLLHPYTGMTCIGEKVSKFCHRHKTEALNKYIIHLDKFSSNSNFLIDVTIKPGNRSTTKEDALSITSKPETSGLDENDDYDVCKVEKSTWINYYARQSTTSKVFILAVIILIISLFITAYKRHEESNP